MNLGVTFFFLNFFVKFSCVFPGLIFSWQRLVEPFWLPMLMGLLRYLTLGFAGYGQKFRMIFSLLLFSLEVSLSLFRRLP